MSDYVSTTIKAESDVTKIEGAIYVDAGGKIVPPWVHTSMGLLNDTLEDFDQDVKTEDNSRHCIY